MAGSSASLLAIAYVRTDHQEEARALIAPALQERNLREFSVRRWLRESTPMARATIAGLRRMAADLAAAGLPDHLDETSVAGFRRPARCRTKPISGRLSLMSVPGGNLLTQDVANLLAAARKPVMVTTTTDTPTIPGTLFVQFPYAGSLDDVWRPRLEQFMRG